MATATSNTELVQHYLDAFNRRDREEMRELLADDVVEHGAHDELRGVDEILEFLDFHFEAFPDYSGQTDQIIADGDTVVVRYTSTGTHSGSYQGIEPTDNSVEWTGVAIYRLEGDQIAEIWLEADRLGLLEQLEVIEPPAHLRL